MLVKALAVVTLDVEVGCRCEAVLAGSLDEAEREALEAGALPDSAGEGEQSFVISLPARPDGAAGGFAYCAFCCRRDRRLPRGYLQQAFVLVSSYYAPLLRKLSSLLARTYLDRGAAAFASAADELQAWPAAPTDGPVQLYLAGVTALGSLRSGLPAALLNGSLEYGEGVGLLLRCPGLLPRLWALWELLLCGRPLLVHSASAALCSEATLGLAACRKHKKTSPMWPLGASSNANQAADWPGLAGAWGSLRHTLALKEVRLGGPAGRSLSHLAFDTGLAALLAPVGYRGLLAPYVSARSPL